MTTFESLELLYEQFSRLSDEIKEMIEDEDFSNVPLKIESKNKLITRIKNARKTVDLSEEDESKLKALEQKLIEKDRENIEASSKIHRELGEELKNTHKKVKVNSAYSIHSESSSGMYINVEE